MHSAAIYAKGTNTEDQVKRCREVARRRGLNVVQEFKDKTSDETVTDLPGLINLMQQVEMGKVDVVIVTGLGRLAQNEAALTDLTRTLSQHKVDLIAGEDR